MRKKKEMQPQTNSEPIFQMNLFLAIPPVSCNRFPDVPTSAESCARTRGPGIEKQGKNVRFLEETISTPNNSTRRSPSPAAFHRRIPDFQNTPDNGHLSVLHDLVEPRTAMSSRPPGPFSLSGSANWPLMHPLRRIDGPYSLVTRAPRSPWRAIGGAPRNRLPSPGAGAAAFISTSIGCRLASPARTLGNKRLI